MRYRKKPLEINALRWTGNNLQEIKDFAGDDVSFTKRMNLNDEEVISLKVKTKEGVLEAPVGSYIIRGIEGEYYPCDPQIFHKTYEPVEKVEITLYSEKMRENNNLPEGVHIMPTQDGDVATISTHKGEEIVSDGDYILRLPNGVVRKISKGSVEYDRVKEWEEKDTLSMPKRSQ